MVEATSSKGTLKISSSSSGFGVLLLLPLLGVLSSVSTRFRDDVLAVLDNKR